jgi:hypothetical protein
LHGLEVKVDFVFVHGLLIFLKAFVETSFLMPRGEIQVDMSSFLSCDLL